jgi:cysteinyl-tRNA synthetase
MLTHNVLCAIALLCLLGCGGGSAPDPGNGNGNGGGGNNPPPGPTQIINPRLRAISDWVYWIQGPDLSQLAASSAGLVVIDYAADGTDASAFTAQQIADLKASGSGKLVICYLSIGEAEDYRYYWGLQNGNPTADWSANPPVWLGPTNPDWAGNYKVRYWNSEWQQLIIANPGGHPVLGNQPSYLDRVIDAGFDGVFLDIVDGFEYWGPLDDGGNGQQATAAADMAAFVTALAAHARSRDSYFIVCQQNGEALISDELNTPLSASQRSALLSAVDWISVEDVFYQGSLDANNPLDADEYRINLIDAYRSAGEFVSIIDYFDQAAPGYSAAALADFRQRSLSHGWLPYSGSRALDRLGP